MINAKCANCGEWLAVPASLAGSTEQCPNCGAHVHLPAPDASSDPTSTQKDKQTGTPDAGRGFRNAGRAVTMAAILVLLLSAILMAFSWATHNSQMEFVDVLSQGGQFEKAQEFLDRVHEEHREDRKWCDLLILLGTLLGASGIGLYSHGESKRGRKASLRSLFSGK